MQTIASTAKHTSAAGQNSQQSRVLALMRDGAILKVKKYGSRAYLVHHSREIHADTDEVLRLARTGAIRASGIDSKGSAVFALNDRRAAR